jgi:parallel beta-helix repeat protein
MRVIKVLILLLICFDLGATKHYVSNSGDNSANGLTPGTAKARPEAITMGRDTMYFERGGIFDSVAIGWVNNHHMTFAAYGTGLKPIITIYDTLNYVSTADTIYTFSHTMLNVSYYRFLPYQARGGWKRFENNYCFLLDQNRNHHEMGRYQADGVYTTITDIGDKTKFKCSSLIGSHPNNYHNGASGKVEIEPWWAESFEVQDWTSADAKFDIANLISAGDGSDSLINDPSYTYKMFLYNHSLYLNQKYEWASNTSDNAREGNIYVHSPTDISGENIFQSVNDSVFGFSNCDTLRFVGLEIHGGNAAGVILYNCDSVVFDSCTFKFNHVSVFSDDGSKLWLTNDSILHTTNMGVIDQRGDVWNVIDCYFHNIGTSEGGGGDGDVSFNGIWSRFPEGEVNIVGNRIDSCGRNGIHIKGVSEGDGNIPYYVYGNYVSRHVTYVQDAAAYYISGSPGTTVEKIIRNNISSHGLYANDAFHCRSTTHHQGIYLDTDARGILVDSNTIIDDYRGILLNGTDTNTIRDNLFVRMYGHGMRFVDRSFGHFGTGTIDCEFYKNTMLNNDADAFGYNYLTWCCDEFSPTFYFDGRGSDSDTNTFANPQDAADQNINMERYYNDYPHSVSDWTDTTANELGAGNGWEENSTVTFVNHYASVSGSITADQCVIGIANWTDSPQTVNLYDLVFFDADSVSYSGSLTLQPNKGVGLVYQSGTAANIDLLPGVIEVDLNAVVGNVIPILESITKQPISNDLSVGFYLTP